VKFFRKFLLGGAEFEVNLAVLACVIEDDDERKVINILRKKVHPQTKSWLRL